MGAECESCLKCADVCPPRAIKAWGEKKTLPELMEVIRADSDFYAGTGGGVTLNGGEVMLQWEFAVMLLKACRESSIHTCVETALHCPREHMESVFEYTDLVIADIKHMDTRLHNEYTGVGNEIILSNIARAAKMGKKIIVRTPVIPGYNGDDENIMKTGAFIRDTLGGAVVQYQLLPYRKLGLEKYESLGLPYPMGDYEPPKRAEWEANLVRLAGMLVDEYGLPATAGSSGKTG
jgi:pyruvate formate lyase activating enzyme